MPTAESTIEVDVPVSTAYNQWTQFESFPEFMQGVERVDQLDDSRTHWVTKIGGVEREYDAEITDQVPDQHIAWHAVGELEQAGRVTFEPGTDGGTRVNLSLTWDPQGFTEKVGSAVNADERMVETDLKNFKSFIESRGAEQGGWRGEIHQDSPTDPGI